MCWYTRECSESVIVLWELFWVCGVLVSAQETVFVRALCFVCLVGFGQSWAGFAVVSAGLGCFELVLAGSCFFRFSHPVSNPFNPKHCITSFSAKLKKQQTANKTQDKIKILVLIW